MLIEATFFYRGLSSGQNHVCSNKFYGLAVPKLRTTEFNMTEEEKQFCNKTEELLLEVMKESLPTTCKDKKDLLYCVLPTNRQFLSSSSRSFHAARYAVTDKSNMLQPHADTQNPREYCHMRDSYMNMPVACFSVTEGGERFAVIGYGRDSVVNFSLRYDKYGECLKQASLHQPIHPENI
eukprot:6386017-Ditylum_brightwellii.AAC.1